MRRSPIIAGAAACLMVAPVAAPVSAAEAPDDSVCQTSECVERVRVKQRERCRAECRERVTKRRTMRRWRRAVRRYGVGRLDARMQCESGHHGGYSLSTTGNGYWFSMQFDAQAWVGAGGRMRHGRPAGVWSMQPSRVEQRFRAIVWERRHGGDAWPNCP